MKKFSDFNITVEAENFIGDKIRVTKILNRPIIVHAFKLDPSKFYAGESLALQIEFEGQKRVVFSGSKRLKEQIKQVPKDGFPFHTTIIEENDMHLFS
ncbi:MULTISPECIES: hypothetical protein [Sphingobacterium]|uniref:Uncharacterized protein n=1 Tax=Sphingobacterium zeae TaxID=1776859 RepID=A0ABU0U5E7_9SPHI|nr:MULTISPECIES: hypothetical protein [Sphingobacterium]MDQ1150177.1 hypothetical protein [Sphingobacterium zeae]